MTALSRVFLSIGVLLVSLSPLQAHDELPPLPSDEILAQLLSYESNVLVQHITIGVVVRGDTELNKSFKTDHAIHVSFIWPVKKNGSRVRAVGKRVFMWNEEFGWFSTQEGTRRGGPVIDVCSEKLGMIEIR